MLTITYRQLKKEIRLARQLAKIWASLESENSASPRALQGLKRASWKKASSEG